MQLVGFTIGINEYLPNYEGS